jgi:DNA-binding transcriptional ArsR family regulator
MEPYEKMAMVMKAMGHPVRLQIMELLELEGPSCVCHLEHKLGLRQAYLSQQLSRLREAGVVFSRREGLNVFYALVDASTTELLRSVKNTAMAVQKVGEDLPRPHILTSEPATPCPCPKCEGRKSPANEDINLGSQLSEEEVPC